MGEQDKAAATGARVTTRFFPVPAPLRPYVSAIYCLDVAAPPGARVDDYLHPEWANLRFIDGEPLVAAIGNEAPATIPRFVVTGPTSHATHFSAGSMRAWGVGILPTGWARLFGIAADEFADRFCDGARHPAFAAVAPLAEMLRGPCDADTAVRQIEDHLRPLLRDSPRDDPAIADALAALVDGDFASVGDLARALGMSERSIERLSLRAFGFPPKLLLRRQRFLRSLARFMLDPTMSWIDALDHHYCDQAQFTRDFQRFMGMSPRTYAACPKPVLAAAALARAAVAGEAVQGLHKPHGQG